MKLLNKNILEMLQIKKKNLLDEKDKKVAIQIDIETFNKIERLLEDYVLVQLMKENKESDKLNLDEAKKFYLKLIKNITKYNLEIIE